MSSEKVKLSKDGSSIDFVQTDNIPTSLKKFRQSPEIEGFYRFIFENDLQKEAFEILDRILNIRKVKKQQMKKEARDLQKEQKAALKLATKTAAKALIKAAAPVKAPAPVKAAVVKATPAAKTAPAAKKVEAKKSAPVKAASKVTAKPAAKIAKPALKTKGPAKVAKAAPKAKPVAKAKSAKPVAKAKPKGKGKK